MKKSAHMRSPADEGFSYKQYPFYLLSRTSARYNAQMEAALRALGIDQKGWRILLVLAEHENLGVARLSEVVVTKLSTTTRIIQRLEEAGYLSSLQSTSDARIKNVMITPAGLGMIKKTRAAAASVFTEAFGDIAEEDVAAFCKVLEAIDRNLRAG